MADQEGATDKEDATDSRMNRHKYFNKVWYYVEGDSSLLSPLRCLFNSVVQVPKSEGKWDGRTESSKKGRCVQLEVHLFIVRLAVWQLAKDSSVW